MDALDVVGVKHVWDMDDDAIPFISGIYLSPDDVVMVNFDGGSTLVRAVENGDYCMCRGCHFSVNSYNCAKRRPFRCGDCILVPLGA